MQGEFYITVPSRWEFPPVASAEQPATLKIRGRGNASWTTPKKSYKLKLDANTELLGMPAHRHFALLACYGAQFELGLFSYMAGLKIAEMVGMDWAPRCRPVELVLNGEYMGMFLLTESIKVDENRVNIPEQPDNCTDPKRIANGWLVEIDNYEDENQILVPEYNEYSNKPMRLTHKSPEKLSPLQLNWLMREFTSINSVLNTNGPVMNQWARHIDPTSAAQYYIVREMINDPDGYNGSFFLHKGSGHDAKWICGPVWDIYSVTKKSDWVINSSIGWATHHIYPYITQTSAFQNALIEEWNKFKPQISELIAFVNSLYYKYMSADRANGRRWERSGDTYEKIMILRTFLYENFQWIDESIMREEEIAPEQFEITLYGRMLYFDVEAVNFRIITLSGRNVMYGENAHSVDLSGLTQGVYFIKAIGPNRETAIKKIVLY